MKRPGIIPGLLPNEYAASAKHAADHAADEAAGAGRIGAAVVVVALRRGLLRLRLCLARGAALRALLVGACSRCRRDDLGQQRLVLQLVEVAALGIAAGGLPARDHRTGRRIELTGGL